MSFTLNFGKESYKFSCSHFTVFGAQIAERMHGHNYRLHVSVSFSSINEETGMALDFNTVKPRIRELCDNLDERILIPLNNPFLAITENENELEVRFGQKRYVLPREDVRLLPLANITCEELSRHMAQALQPLLPPQITALSVTVEETHGQSATYQLFG